MVEAAILKVEDPTVPQSPLTIFVATLPDQFGRQSACLTEAEKIKDTLILHPYYDFNSVVGKKTLSIIGDTVPAYTSSWENIMRKDFFCVEKSDVVVFDLDAKNNGDISYFLAVAACYNKPIIAVSSSLLSVSAYFSGSVICVIKPSQLESILKLALSDDKFLSLPKEKNSKETEAETEITDTETKQTPGEATTSLEEIVCDQKT